MKTVYPIPDFYEVGRVFLRDGHYWIVESVFEQEEDGYLVRLAEVRDFDPVTCPNCGIVQIQRPAFCCFVCAVGLEGEE